MAKKIKIEQIKKMADISKYWEHVLVYLASVGIIIFLSLIFWFIFGSFDAFKSKPVEDKMAKNIELAKTISYIATTTPQSIKAQKDLYNKIVESLKKKTTR